MSTGWNTGYTSTGVQHRVHVNRGATQGTCQQGATTQDTCQQGCNTGYVSTGCNAGYRVQNGQYPCFWLLWNTVQFSSNKAEEGRRIIILCVTYSLHDFENIFCLEHLQIQDFVFKNVRLILSWVGNLSLTCDHDLLSLRAHSTIKCQWWSILASSIFVVSLIKVFCKHHIIYVESFCDSVRWEFFLYINSKYMGHFKNKILNLKFLILINSYTRDIFRTKPVLRMAVIKTFFFPTAFFHQDFHCTP